MLQGNAQELCFLFFSFIISSEVQMKSKFEGVISKSGFLMEIFRDVKIGNFVSASIDYIYLSAVWFNILSKMSVSMRKNKLISSFFCLPTDKRLQFGKVRSFYVFEINCDSDFD